MKTVFITGANGLIGRELTQQLLEKGYNVFATDTTPSPFVGKPNYTFVQTNVFDKGKITPILESGRINSLIHLACSVDNDFPSEINDKEMGDSRSADKYIYRSAASAGVRDIIILSTTQIYAVQKTREPIRETADEKPVTNYAKMKSESEMALAAAVKNFSNTKAVSMRVAPIYTKEHNQNLHDRIYDYKDRVAYLYGEGLYSFSMCSLYNVIDFIIGVLNQDGKYQYQGVYNICDSKPITAKEIVEFEREFHHLGPVIQKSEGVESIKSTFLLGNKKAKNDYRYIDPATVTNSIMYDNTKAQRISTFRWNLYNTK